MNINDHIEALEGVLDEPWKDGLGQLTDAADTAHEYLQTLLSLMKASAAGEVSVVNAEPSELQMKLMVQDREIRGHWSAKHMYKAAIPAAPDKLMEMIEKGEK